MKVEGIGSRQISRDAENTGARHLVTLQNIVQSTAPHIDRSIINMTRFLLGPAGLPYNSLSTASRFDDK